MNISFRYGGIMYEIEIYMVILTEEQKQKFDAYIENHSAYYLLTIQQNLQKDKDMWITETPYRIFCMATVYLQKNDKERILYNRFLELGKMQDAFFQTSIDQIKYEYNRANNLIL